MADLMELAAKCEAAAGPDRELDSAIVLALFDVDRGAKGGWCDARGTVPHPWNYTASLDAAMTLVPEGCVLAVTNCDADGKRPDFAKASAIVARDPDGQVGPTVAATMPLALCAAALRARASSVQSGGE